MFPSGNDAGWPGGQFGRQFNGGDAGDKPPEWLMGASAEEYETEPLESFGGDLLPAEDFNRILNIGLHFFEGLKDI